MRKQLGVWYTSAEVVRYMVARMDKALQDDLHIPDGLAAENVSVLDPCCGTGAYLTEGANSIALGDPGFSQPPPRRIVRIRWRQGPQTMEMIREDDHSIDGKGPFFGDVSKCLAQKSTGPGVTEHRASASGNDSEKVGGPRDKSAAVAHKRGEGMSDYAYGSSALQD